ncbi:MAG: hypothetical protein GEV12_14245 [Micromonosporaceae bacterium]|nr:hypothetical protein [Micromonosporaceae bacterium]
MPDVAYVCQASADQLASALHAAADLWPELQTTIAGLARMADPGPRARGHTPPQPIRPGLGNLDRDHQLGPPTGLPFNWSASVDAEDIRSEISGWCRIVVEERYGHQPPHGPICAECDHPTCEHIHARRRWMPPPTTVAASMRWLAGQLGWLRYREYAGEAWRDLRDVTGWLHRAVDRPANRTRFPVGPCPEITAGGVPCAGQVTAVIPAREDRPALMECGTCGERWPTIQWARVGRRMLKAQERMMT